MQIAKYLLAFVVSFCAANWLGESTKQPPQQIPKGPQAVVSEFQHPSSKLLPEEIVQIQVNALQRFSNDPTAIKQCFMMASPFNRAVTGPLDRFSALVVTPGYRTLVTGTHALVGKSIILGSKASVLVTVLNGERTPVLFRFFLSKQASQSYQNCWMTDAVIAIHGRIPTDPHALLSPDA